MKSVYSIDYGSLKKIFRNLHLHPFIVVESFLEYPYTVYLNTYRLHHNGFQLNLLAKTPVRYNL